MHTGLRETLPLLAILIGICGMVLKSQPVPVQDGTALAVLSARVADMRAVIPLSNRGPYEVRHYVARNCLGEIWVLPLHRNGEAADLLPAVEGFVLDGQVSTVFPATAFALARLLAFAGVRTDAPQVFAFRETGNCSLARHVGQEPH